MSKRQERKPEQRPDEILDAATRVFARRGFDGARMDDIARQAGLSKGALYLYFESKEALLEAILARFSDQFATIMTQEAVEQARRDPQQAIRTLVHAAVTLASDPDVTLVPRLLMAEATRNKKIAALYRTRLLNLAEEAISAILAEGVRRGLLRQVRAESLMRTILGPVIAHMLLSHVFVVEGQAALSPSVFEEDLLAVVLGGLELEAA